jgi:methyltransferase (TIGR00027 family)
VTLNEAAGTRLALSTAEAAAALRAASAAARDELVRGPDRLAARFVETAPRLTAIVKVPLLRRLAPLAAERLLPGSYWYELARVRHMDGVLRREVAAGARQVVVLGAGFDSRAYRFADRLAGIPTFEVDHPVTASVKRARVRRILGALPRHVRYVNADLAVMGQLEERLAAGGFRHDRRTLVIWSGVTPYIPEHGVDAVLRWLARDAAPGSSIVFDYAYREAVEGSGFFYGAPQLRRRLAEGGEPLRFGVCRDAIGEFVARRGLELLSDLGPELLEQRYLVRRERLAGRPYGFVAIAHARVPVVASPVV